MHLFPHGRAAQCSTCSARNQKAALSCHAWREHSCLPAPPPRLQAGIPSCLLADGEQRCIAAGGGGVDGEGALAGEAQQIVRTARLGAGSGEALAAERLYPHHRADLVAVDIAVADAGMAADEVDRGVDAAVHAQGEAVAGAVDLVDDLPERAGLEA